MVYDQAQSARLGQRTGIEQPGIRLVETTADVEAPYLGQMVYEMFAGALRVWDGTEWAAITGGTGGSDGVVLSFPVPELTWTGVHNMGQAIVDVTMMDSLGNMISGGINYPDANTVQATFKIAVAGYMLVQK
jgi:hypothetical protein